MTEHDTSETPMPHRLADHWKAMFAVGLVLVIGGALAFFNPLVASLTVEAIAAAAFFVSGILKLWMALGDLGSSGDRVAHVVLGTLFVLFAMALMLNPLAGLVSLTLLVGAFFLAMGLMRLYLAFQLRDRDSWGWMAASGAVSVLLGLLVFAAVPKGAPGLLGLFLAVELVTSGAGTMALALGLRRHA